MAKTKFEFGKNVIAKLNEKSYSYFHTMLANDNYLINIVKSLIVVGISPVATKGRFQRYSESYKAVIQGKMRFFTRGGRVIPVMLDKSVVKIRPGKILEGQTKIGYSKSYAAGMGVGKKVSPVNMTLTGAMLDSMYLEKRTNKSYLGFSDKKAVYHNDLGAGKSGVIRRLLPTKDGEKFVSNVDSRLKRLGKLAVATTMNDSKALLTVKFVFRIK